MKDLRYLISLCYNEDLLSLQNYNVIRVDIQGKYGNCKELLLRITIYYSCQFTCLCKQRKNDAS